MGTAYLGIGNDTFTAYQEYVEFGKFKFNVWKPWTISGNDGNDILTGGKNNDTIQGGRGNDQLYGLEGNDVLSGGDNNDFIRGDDGNDTLYGGAGDDFLVGWNDNDTMYGGANNDTLWAGNGDDRVYGEDGNDQLAGWNGNDSLYGGIGDDVLNGETGSDFMYGGIGNDTYYVDQFSESARDVVQEDANAGIDTVIFSAYYYSMPSNVENVILTDSAVGVNGRNGVNGNDLNNVIIGNSARDHLWGNKGDDSLFGGDGDDVLVGYSHGFVDDEYDTLTGGSGADIFEIGSFFKAYYLEEGNSAGGYAFITDFDYNESDKIQAHGSESDYNLVLTSGFGSSAPDTAIYYKGDLIAVAQDVSGSDILLHLDFNFVT